MKKSKLKKLLLAFVITTNSFLITTFASTNLTLDDQKFKNNSSTTIAQYSPDNSALSLLDESELELIEKNYSISSLNKASNEVNLANQLYSLTNDLNLKNKIISVERQDKIDAMLEMINILEKYSINIELENLIKNYISQYGPYTENDTLINYAHSLYNNGIQPRSTYSRTSAVNYAYTWWNSYNLASYPNLTYLGGDCANFVSQALVAGGKTTDSNWYIRKLNSNNNTPTTVSQLNSSWSVSNPSPWISAVEFNNYWSSRATSTETYAASLVYNNQQYVYNRPFYIGDAVQILVANYWWYEGYHTMLITSYDSTNKDFKLTYHTTNRKDVNLNSIANSYNSDKYQFRFFGM